MERSRGARPIPANCLPEMTVVPLKLTDGSDIKDPTIVVFPSCTRVKRCSGCCTNNLVSCQAVETNNIVYEVCFRNDQRCFREVKIKQLNSMIDILFSIVRFLNHNIKAVER